MVQHYDREAIPQVYNIDEIPTFDTREGVESRAFRGVDTLVGIASLYPEMERKPHRHPWEQVVCILEGECNFHVDDEVVSVSKGDMFVIPPDVEHCAETTSDEPCLNMDIWPLREDYVYRTEYQEEFLD